MRLFGVRHARRGIWILTGLAAGLVIAIVMFAAAVPLSSGLLRHRIVKTLSSRLNSDVELGDLHMRLFPRMTATGFGLIIRQRRRTDVPPLITIKQFTVDADLVGLLRKHVAGVELIGLEIQIPPGDHDEDHPATPDRGLEARAERTDSPEPVGTVGSQGTPQTRDGGKPHTDPSSLEDGVVVDTVVSKDARLVIIPRNKARQPKVWAIHRLKLHTLGANSSSPFEATLTNAVPPGEIESSGNFGPWQPDAPGSTPVNGGFTFAKADLSVFKGIGGTLASKGRFDGSLNWIDVHGETDTPDFVINVGGHPFPLHTKYHTVVDGTNGDTRLELIDGTFLQSHLFAKGAVLDSPEPEKGRTVTLDINMDRARIEDVMRMAVHTPQPPMTGGLRLTTNFVLPPGEMDVVDRLRLDGRFEMSSARFTNYDIQAKIDELSHRGSGKDLDETRGTVYSQFDGRFKLAGGRLTLPQLTFATPGARVELAGHYNLKRETLLFAGTMFMDATISQTQSGWKSLLLKAVDPFFKKEGGGSAIPFKISGTRSNPSFGLDYRRVFHRDEKSQTASRPSNDRR